MSGVTSVWVGQTDLLVLVSALAVRFSFIHVKKIGLVSSILMACHLSCLRLVEHPSTSLHFVFCATIHPNLR